MPDLPYTIPLHRAHLFEELVARKFVDFSDLLRSGVLQPPGFVVTNEGRKLFFEENGLEQKLSDLLSTVNFEDPDSVANFSRLAISLIVNGKNPKILGDIFKFHLDSKSSESFEFLLYRDSRGQGFVSKVSLDAVFEMAKKIWAFGFTPQNLLLAKGRENSVTFLVQHIPKIYFEGTISTVNHETANKNERVLRVSKQDYFIDRINPSKPEGMLDHHFNKLLDFVSRIENHFYLPQQISFFATSDGIYFLDSRELTPHVPSKVTALDIGFDGVSGYCLVGKRHVGKAIMINNYFDFHKVRKHMICLVNNEKLLRDLLEKRQPGGVVFTGELSLQMRSFLHKKRVLVLETLDSVNLLGLNRTGVLDGREMKFYLR